MHTRNILTIISNRLNADNVNMKDEKKKTNNKTEHVKQPYPDVKIETNSFAAVRLRPILLKQHH